jgi:hypothetical protein
MKIKNSWFLVLVLVACFLVAFTVKGRTYSRTAWEYKQITYNTTLGLEKILDDLGAEGWEMVQFVPYGPHSGGYIFKRAK